MKFTGTKVLNGPNYWSAENFQLLQLSFQDSSAINLQPSQVLALQKDLKNLLNFDCNIHDDPKLVLPNFIAQLATALQMAAGMPMQPFYTVANAKDKTLIVFSYANAATGKMAAET